MKFTTLLALVASANGAILMVRSPNSPALDDSHSQHSRRLLVADISPFSTTNREANPSQGKREASPEALPDPNPWCGHVGQPCWKVKRAAEAFANTIASFSAGLEARDPALVAERSAAEGFHAGLAARAVDHLAGVVAVARDAAPESFYSGLALEKKFAEPEPAPAEAQEDKRWCGHVGQPCWKRAVEEDKRWCGHVGQPCWRARRAAEAVLASIGDIRAREADPWCGHVGQPCWKREAEAHVEDEKRWCGHVGQPCWKAKRDLHAMAHAARSVIEALE